MSLQAADIVLLPFPFTDLSSQKRRPALILRAPDALGDFVALAITSRPQYEASIAFSQSDIAGGTLPKPSWIRVDKPYTFNASIVVAHFGRLTAEKFQQVREQSCAQLGCHD